MSLVLKVDRMPVSDTTNPVRHVQRRIAVQFLVDDQRENQNTVHSCDNLWRLCRYAVNIKSDTRWVYHIIIYFCRERLTFGRNLKYLKTITEKLIMKTMFLDIIFIIS